MKLQYHSFLWLLRRELSLGKRLFVSDAINVAFVFLTNAVVYGYLFLKDTTASNFGASMLVGAVATHGLFRTVWKAMTLSADMQHNKLSAQLVMPVPPGYIFASRAISWAFWEASLMIVGLFVGKLFLLDNFPLKEINVLKMFPMFVTVNLFYSFFAVWIASLLGGLVNSIWIYPRVVSPMFMFGCFYYTFAQVREKYETFSYLVALNPVTYCVEGLRASMLAAPEQYLGVGVCMAVLWTCIALFFWHSLVRFKKKYDLY